MPGPGAEYYRQIPKDDVLKDLNGMISRRTFVIRTAGSIFGFSALAAAAGAGDYVLNTSSKEDIVRDSVRKDYPQPDPTNVVYAHQTFEAFQTPVAQAIRNNEEQTIPTAIAVLGVKNADNILKANDQSEQAQNQALEKAGIAQRSRRDLYLFVTGVAGMALSAVIGGYNFAGRSDLLKESDHIHRFNRNWYTQREVESMKMGPGI